MEDLSIEAESLRQKVQALTLETHDRTAAAEELNVNLEEKMVMIRDRDDQIDILKVSRTTSSSCE